MKYILIVTVFFAVNPSVQGQTEQIDSLVEHINNEELVGVCHYFWMLEMNSSAGKELIKIGKSSTDRLVNVLTDTSKGIIAHYILSNVWLDKVQTSNSWTRYESQGIIDYTIGPLCFYWSDKMKAEANDLLRNRGEWLRYFAKKNGR